MNLLLIGYRGTGKTTVAQLLALELGWDWVDADVEIELAAGKNIAAIFLQEGEQGFRQREAEIVRTLCRRDKTVIALGGGAILREENRQAIGRAGKVVLLTASPETVWRRLQTDPATASRRPNLTTGGFAEIAAVLAERQPVYRQCADVEVDTEGKSPQHVAAAVLGHPTISSAVAESA
jgi:shikimate kinase